ncbi:Uncharacterised protein [Streptococcus pseudopneumoniae]|uniref:Uncharacterized protein n=1 Tax=Streptococcus pseudopneumoniae TaxID=257758 RepID=A0A0U0D667_9STRE|nr:hypothetical protein HMPREF1046_1537 [Streptococcus pseudopneumoniae ATCC BAA-960 = CCUG 49455]ETD92256.1 hypothetical protein U752_09205 [Streptococcus pseudopneumoniae 1321]CEY61569.1 Uncharacterised protein [Streptococcus pseudopneumoniae]CIO37967.1 Uncharacterised protein [Streptococcus pseudopneumoniae]CIP56825.1 Uncharacterised protein [Streptococcus pseudopneumoniae]
MKDKKVQLFATIVFIMNLLLAIVSLFDTSIFKHVFLIVSYLVIMFAFLIYIVANTQ